MSLFSIFRRPSLDDGVAQAEREGGVILDVRTREEFAEGHLPNAVNVPLDVLERAKLPQGKLFVYCYSGARSSRAVGYLKSIGKNAVNIGGIAGYGGRVERGV